MVSFRSLLRTLRGFAASHLLLAGDMNFPQIDWGREFSRAPAGHPSHSLLDAVQDNFLFQHVREATRIREGEANNVLDLVFTNEEGMDLWC